MPALDDIVRKEDLEFWQVQLAAAMISPVAGRKAGSFAAGDVVTDAFGRLGRLGYVCEAFLFSGHCAEYSAWWADEESPVVVAQPELRPAPVELTLFIDAGTAPPEEVAALLADDGAAAQKPSAAVTGSRAGRILIRLLGGPRRAYSLLRAARDHQLGQLRCPPSRRRASQCQDPIEGVKALGRPEQLPCIVFNETSRIVAWTLPAGRFGCLDLSVWRYDGPTSPVSLRVLPMLAPFWAQRQSAKERVEGLHDMWCKYFSPADDGKVDPQVFGRPFMPPTRCCCGRYALTAGEAEHIARVTDGAADCAACREKSAAWDRQADLEAERQRGERKAALKAIKAKKAKQHHGSSARPYSQKRR